jgi:hypothetical protein
VPTFSTLKNTVGFPPNSVEKLAWIAALCGPAMLLIDVA